MAEEKQQYLMQLNMLQERGNQLEEQVQQVNSQIKQFEDLKKSLEEIDDVDENHEMLAPVGRGIYFLSKIQNKKLFVNVGSNIVLRKKPEQAKKIVDKQVEQLKKIKNNLLEEIEKLNQQLRQVIEKARNQR